MKPKENPEDRKARLRERRMSLLEQDRAARTSARDLTGDIGRTYGLRGLSMFGMRGTAMEAPAASPVRRPVREQR